MVPSHELRMRCPKQWFQDLHKVIEVGELRRKCYGNQLLVYENHFIAGVACPGVTFLI